MAFKIAGSMAVQEAAKRAGIKLLEPIMEVEVTTPEDYMGSVVGDLSARRGKVGEMGQQGASRTVRAQVPLAEMFGYATDLRSLTQGRASYSMQFHSYQDMPQSIAEEVVAARKGIPIAVIRVQDTDQIQRQQGEAAKWVRRSLSVRSRM